MTDLDKQARELVASEYERDGFMQTAGMLRAGHGVYTAEPALRATRAALLTAPPGYVLVPVVPTDEMVDAASDAHMPFGDMRFAITSAILAAPEVK